MTSSKLLCFLSSKAQAFSASNSQALSKVRALNSYRDTAKMLFDSGLMPRGLDVASLSDQVAQPTYAERSHLSHHQPFQNGSLVSGTRARPVTPPYGSGTRPPGGYYEEPSFHQQRAHLQPLFRAEEFPEIGREMPVFGEAPDERAPVHEGERSVFHGRASSPCSSPVCKDCLESRTIANIICQTKGVVRFFGCVMTQSFERFVRHEEPTELKCLRLRFHRPTD